MIHYDITLMMPCYADADAAAAAAVIYATLPPLLMRHLPCHMPGAMRRAAPFDAAVLLTQDSRCRYAAVAQQDALPPRCIDVMMLLLLLTPYADYAPLMLRAPRCLACLRCASYGVERSMSPATVKREELRHTFHIADATPLLCYYSIATLYRLYCLILPSPQVVCGPWYIWQEQVV